MWYFFAILSAAFYGITVIFDKFLLTKHIRNPFSYLLVVYCFTVLFAFSILVFQKAFFTYPLSFFAFLIGFLPLCAFVFYVKGIQVEEASRVTPLMFITPLFVVLITGIFGLELLSSQKYLGIFLLVLGSVLISYKKLGFSRALHFLVFACFFWACAAVLVKYVLFEMSYWNIYFWTSVGGVTSSLFLLAKKRIRNDFFRIIRLKRKAFFTTGIAEFFCFLGTIFFYIALLSNSASLVSALGATQPFFVLIYASILSIFMPKILKEKMIKRIILLKILATLLIFIGSFLVIV